MENQNQQTPKVFGYFRVGNKSQLDTDWQQSSTDKNHLDNQSEDVDDIGAQESDLAPDIQMDG